MNPIDPALFEEGERMVAASDTPKVQPIGRLQLEHGASLDAFVAYQTWGTYTGDNAVLVCHAISGDSNAVGWWPRLIGPGKAIDTDKFFVICSNVIGGCRGSTGPGSMGSGFPFVTVGDFVEAQKGLLDSLGVPKLAMVCGGSMGGMQALEWARRFPGRVDRVWMTASAGRHSAMQIGFNEVARQAIRRDPNWNGGDYGENPPIQGLALARMLGHLTYLSETAFEAKFGREWQREQDAWTMTERSQYQVESYLNYQGEKFTQRFEANSFLVVSQAIDVYDGMDLVGVTARFLLTSFTSDWLYPPSQSEALHAAAGAAGVLSHWVNIESPMGHDAFLLEDAEQPRLVRKFLTAEGQGAS